MAACAACLAAQAATQHPASSRLLVSPHLASSRLTSLHLASPRLISPHLASTLISPHTSPHLASPRTLISPRISPHFFFSRPLRDRPKTDPRPEIDPRSTRDRPEIDPRSARAINPTMPQSPLRGDPPSPRVSVSFASHRWGAGGGARCTGEAGEGGVHSEDCRPRGGFVPQGFTLRVRIGAARG